MIASIANRGLAAIKAANILMSLAITASLGALMLASLNCSMPLEPQAGIDTEDSMAVAAVFRANNLPWPGDRSFLGTDQAGHVIRLSLYSKGLQVLPREIGRLTRLQELVLANNLLATLPQEMEALTELTVLDASGNLLDSVPDGYGLVHLQRLDLSRNRLTALPLNINVTRLEVLYLEGNRIRSLPPDFHYLTVLRELGLSSNLLDSLPADIGELRALRHLNVSRNALRTLPASLTGLELDYLNVGGNHLCFPDTSDSASVAMTRWLDDRDRDWRASQTCP
jgi:hypothetical protein